MNESTLKKLLSQDEGEFLEFKESIDLKTKEGKGKFIKKMLALANSTIDRSYVVIGVEDKTKKPIGCSDLREEQLQQILSNYCRPPINFKFHLVNYAGVQLGVIEIFHKSKFHTLNKTFEYSVDGKPATISEKAVFVKRGSIVDEATMDEVVEMAQSDSTDLANISFELEKINDQLEEIVDQRSHRDNPHSEYIDRLVETTAVGMLSGGILAWLWQPDMALFVFIPFLVSLFFMVIGSAIKIFHYSMFRAFITTLLFGMIFGIIFDFGNQVQWIIENNKYWLLFGLLIGTICGFVSQLIISSFERKIGN